MKIALIGASGFIGSGLREEALARGHQVTALVSNPAKLAAAGKIFGEGVAYGFEARAHVAFSAQSGRQIIGLHCSILVHSPRRGLIRIKNPRGAHGVMGYPLPEDLE